jgi:hypothetical protein
MSSWLRHFAARDAEPAAKIEILEDRRLLSAQFDTLALLDGDALAGPAVLASANTGVRAAIKNVVGRYKGTVKINGVPQAIPASLNIKKQTADGKLSGTISSVGLGVTNFAVKGTINNKGVFTTTYNKGGVTGSLSGKVAKSGALKGTFAAKYQGINVTGTFSFTKLT